MRGLERELFEEFKRVDGICRDLRSSPRGVSGYLEEMERAAARGRRWVPAWERDYRALKRARWLRNKLAHELTETDCTADDCASSRTSTAVSCAGRTLLRSCGGRSGPGGPPPGGGPRPPAAPRWTGGGGSPGWHWRWASCSS